MYSGHFHLKGQEHFWFRGRAELVDILCKEFLTPSSDRRMLDIGAGEGDITTVLAQYGTVTALDAKTDALEKIPLHLHIQKKAGDAVALPFPDNSFDVACLFDVLEHIEDDTQAVAEALRVLKPSGLLLITVPLHQRLFSAHDRANDHKRRYSIGRVHTLLSHCTALRMGYWNSTLLPFIAVVRMLRKNKKPRFDDDRIPKWLNTFFWKIIQSENWLIAHRIPLWWGLSCFGVFRKN